MLIRPDSLEPLGDTLIRLALEGEIPGEDPSASWLESLGVVERFDGRIGTREEWVLSTFPAKSQRDLIRQVAFRDPAYRMHLDILLAQVLIKMANDNRMAKVEDYLKGPLSRFAPRLVYILDRRKLVGTDKEEWVSIEKNFIGIECLQRFNQWDKTLFDDILGGVEQRFPIVTDLYGPMASCAVYFRPSSLKMPQDEVALLIDIVTSGADRQGLYLSKDEEVIFDSIVLKTCLPLRKWREDSAKGTRVASISPIVLIGSKEIRGCDRSRCSVPGELSADLIGNKVIEASIPPDLSEGFWSVTETGGRTGAFPGYDIYDSSAHERIKFDPDAPELALKLSKHRMFGLLIQLFIIGAFSHELGDDCLNILPVGSAEQPDRIDVYYRPDKEVESFALLGSLDEVLSFVALRMGLFTIPPLWVEDRHRIWTQATLVLKQAKVLAYRAGEYWLSEKFFDVCHSGTYMKEILRRGKYIRDQMQGFLSEKFKEKSFLSKETEKKT